MNTDTKIYIVSNVYETILKYSGYTPTSEEEDMLLNAILARYNHMRHLIRSGSKIKLIESMVSDARPYVTQFENLVNPPTRCDTVFEHPCENISQMDVDEPPSLLCVAPIMYEKRSSKCAAPDTEPFVNVSVDFSQMQFDQVNNNVVDEVQSMVLDNDFDEDIYS
jgi:hypothetical protein